MRSCICYQLPASAGKQDELYGIAVRTLADAACISIHYTSLASNLLLISIAPRPQEQQGSSAAAEGSARLVSRRTRGGAGGSERGLFRHFTLSSGNYTS